MRARNIKPGFFKSEGLASCTPLARLLFIGLWCMADREGRLEDRPARIKAELFPYEKADIEKLLIELSDKTDCDGTPSFIVRYGQPKQYIQILHFLSHQNPHFKEKESEIPAISTSLSLASVLPQSCPKQAVLNPDTGYLIPDTGILNPDSIYSQVLDYLNEKIGTNFKTVESNKKHIRARVNEGYYLEAFYTVIDKKVAEWTGTDQQKYLRPETLFGTKFDGYLNQQVKQKPMSNFEICQAIARGEEI